MEIISAINYRLQTEALLTENKLPINDLPESFENFFVAIHDGEVIGVVGFEIYGGFGLLRSLAVKTKFRNQGVANQLLAHIEKNASAKNLGAIYLLTETADKYFDKKHYIVVARTEVPAEIQVSSEFSWVCPQSAIVMKKTL